MFEHYLAESSGDLVDLVPGDTAAAQHSRQSALEIGEPQPHLQVVHEVAADDGPHHHARTAPVEGLPVVARVVERLVGGVEEHELERIGGGDLPGGHLVRPPVVLEVRHETAKHGWGTIRLAGPGFAGQVGPQAIRGRAALRIAS